ncbi:ABC transporter ATP-binding protein [Thiomicrospira sp. R3]|uniref:ABC transporter ATP-binding protein n=1 Tax=Thiomicrospira sp. R3 TaxID=3035472 RepID=UPI00259B99B2|nr:ABC transporter ATP-binding protein [Thiomicrospira sp. R3]WFE68887.1 ABC transporter ATP-binding protein [Thiomicrospira sp. R3]
MSDKQAAVAFKAVSKSFGELQALNAISFEVNQGSFFGLLGPNGAGKSTLINAMSSLVVPSSGEISVMGYDVQKEYRQARRSLGLVPQELISDPFFSIRDLLRVQSGYFGLRGREQWAWVDELLERLALADKSDAQTAQLSGGMKRRVLIAMALVHKPAVLVLDEPTAGVDVDLRRTLWAFARELHAAGHTIILTTHYLEEAEALCDQVAIMQKGEVKALEKTQALLARHPYRYLRITLPEQGSFNPQSISSELALRLVEREANALLFKIEKSLAMEQVLAWLQQDGLNIKDLTSRDASLEEVFLDLTGAQL